MNILTALRSHTVNGIRHNFSRIYRKALHCPLNCENESFKKGDTQSQIFACKALSVGVQQPLIDIYSEDINKQANAKKTQAPGGAQSPTRGFIPGPVLLIAAAVGSGYC